MGLSILAVFYPSGSLSFVALGLLMGAALLLAWWLRRRRTTSFLAAPLALIAARLLRRG